VQPLLFFKLVYLILMFFFISLKIVIPHPLTDQLINCIVAYCVAYLILLFLLIDENYVRNDGVQGDNIQVVAYLFLPSKATQFQFVPDELLC